MSLRRSSEHAPDKPAHVLYGHTSYAAFNTVLNRYGKEFTDEELKVLGYISTGWEPFKIFPENDSVIWRTVQYSEMDSAEMVLKYYAKKPADG